jgi:type II secretory pathway pseudopilin PulG
MKDKEKKNIKNRLGFTFVELIMIIGITVIMASAAMPMFNGMQTNTQVDEAVYQTMQNVRQARLQSISGLRQSAHGIFLSMNQPDANDKVVTYQGSSYLTRESLYDQEYILENNLKLSTDILGRDMNFSLGLGQPNNIGTITIEHNITNQSKTLTLNSLGIISK